MCLRDLIENFVYFAPLAVGCVLPQIPDSVKIVSRLENLLRFSCEENHVFPDTLQSDRAIVCINENWNDTVSKCVGKSYQCFDKPLCDFYFLITIIHFFYCNRHTSAIKFIIRI